MARPRKEIDFELAEKLAQIHCTQEEIASVLDMSVDTLQRSKKFNELYNKARLLGLLMYMPDGCRYRKEWRRKLWTQ